MWITVTNLWDYTRNEEIDRGPKETVIVDMYVWSVSEHTRCMVPQQTLFRYTDHVYTGWKSFLFILRNFVLFYFSLPCFITITDLLVVLTEGEKLIVIQLASFLFVPAKGVALIQIFYWPWPKLSPLKERSLIWCFKSDFESKTHSRLKSRFRYEVL